MSPPDIVVTLPAPVQVTARPPRVTIGSTARADLKLRLGADPVALKVGPALAADTEIIVIPGAAGPQGPPGPTGPTGGDGFTHEQTSPSASWNVTHNLGRKPHTTVIVDDEVVITDVRHTSDNAVNIVFASPTSGIAYLS